MSGCGCSNTSCFDGASRVYRRALWLVIAINAAMFFVELTAGVAAGSQALQADALDFLGDTFTYAISLLVIGQALRWRARAALFKGLSLATLGLWVLGSTVYHTLILGIPQVLVMSAVGLLALAANFTSVIILFRFRNGDANVRSVWLCSRNDALGNLAVVMAAGGVFATETAWPDLAVAGIMASLFLHSALTVVRQALAELRASGAAQAAGQI